MSPPEQHAVAEAFRARVPPESPSDLWHLLGQVFDVHLRHGGPAELFEPTITIGGSRSMVPDDQHDATQAAAVDQGGGRTQTVGRHLEAHVYLVKGDHALGGNGGRALPIGPKVVTSSSTVSFEH